MTGKVLREDGVDRHPADALPREDRLDDDRAAEQRAELQTDDRHDRDEGVLQAVAKDHDGGARAPSLSRSVMYSWRSTSSILERTRRAMIADAPKPSVKRRAESEPLESPSRRPPAPSAA